MQLSDRIFYVTAGIIHGFTLAIIIGKGLGYIPC